MSNSYTILAAKVAAEEIECVPDEPGVYVVLEPRGGNVVNQLAPTQVLSQTLRGRRVLYVGCSSSSIQRRLRSHLVGNSMKSTLRMTLGALLLYELKLTPRVFPGQTHFGFGSGEATLTDWMQNSLEVAFRVTNRALDVEFAMIKRLKPALNISFVRDTEQGQRLLELRASISGRWV